MQKNLWSALDDLDAPEISADFDARLYARIAQEEAQPMWRAWRDRLFLSGLALTGFTWKPVLAGVTTAAVLAVGLTMHAPKSQDASRQIRPDSVDVEQLEVTLQDLDLLTPPSAANGKTPAGKM